ncbi:hypothetical protein NPRO_02110 [Candidatus Nitrosymbiomonas proteolyticus]|uniref:Uncharacterized protein n=1 Tax=Candidatus Nitrosymbiomonas proteolyticus TaxID=2608984 RepID=A0A809S2B2_9BACT|nr:hypothetical protein NPRO_02110 [Candidatus Nitrosymbiomonas proteolyticus]
MGMKAKRALIAHFRKDFDEAGRSEKVRVPIYAVPDDGTGSQARDARAGATSNSFWGAPGLMAILWDKPASYGCHPKLVLGCSGAFTAGVFPTAPAMGFGTVPDERHGPPPIRATRSVALVGLCPRDATGATPNSFWGALARRGRSLGVPSLPSHPVT